METKKKLDIFQNELPVELVEAEKNKGFRKKTCEGLSKSIPARFLEGSPAAFLLQ